VSDLKPHSALAGRLTATGPSPAGVTVASCDDLALATVIARKGQLAPLAQKVRILYDIALPTGPKRVTAGAIAVIGMGPGQWLAVEQASRDPQAFAAKLKNDLAGLASIADQSDARAVVRLSGPAARQVLAKGLPVDLHPSVFGPGDAALSQIALIGAHVWQLDETPTYEIAVFRSLAGSFADWLIASAAEFGIAAMS
jgi:heterotetrameric sarcosine oxidase gamma subunit